MDKIVEVLVVLLVVMMTAGIVMAIFGVRVGPFSDTVGNETDDAQCQISETKYRNACNCEPDPPEETDRAESIRQESSCDWASGASCSSLC